MQNLTANKTKDIFENKLRESICKSKDLSKTIKSLRQPNKSGRCIVGAFAEYQMAKHDFS